MEKNKYLKIIALFLLVIFSIGSLFVFMDKPKNAEEIFDKYHKELNRLGNSYQLSYNGNIELLSQYTQAKDIVKVSVPIKITGKADVNKNNSYYNTTVNLSLEGGLKNGELFNNQIETENVEINIEEYFVDKKHHKKVKMFDKNGEWQSDDISESVDKFVVTKDFIKNKSFTETENEYIIHIPGMIVLKNPTHKDYFSNVLSNFDIDNLDEISGDMSLHFNKENYLMNEISIDLFLKEKDSDSSTSLNIKFNAKFLNYGEDKEIVFKKN